MDWRHMVEKGLRWTQPSAFRREFTLLAGDQQVGTLRFEKAFGSLATADLAGQRWTLKREGFWQPRVNVRQPGSAANLAVFRANWSGGGTLEFPDGRRYGWKCLNFWGSQWGFLSPDESPMLTFKHDGVFKTEARAEHEPSSRTLPEAPLLVALGWYLMVLAAEDSAAVAAIG